MKNLFIAATGQNVGKTTVCLGLLAGLQKRYSSVGFIKPVGQEHLETEGLLVDKDAVLFKSCFQLADPYQEMSPVLFPQGFTRDFLDGKISHHDLTQKILTAYKSVSSRHPITLVEGTGHIGVGSIVDLNNAQVAALLGCPVILIAPGGLGSSFDSLALNRSECERRGARVCGVILNRVLPEKREMAIKYMTQALSRWEIPLLGCIPYNQLLSNPTMNDFSLLFETELLAGHAHRLRHFEQIRLTATSAELFRTFLSQNQLIITPASREDIIITTLTCFQDFALAHPGEELQIGLILTGREEPKASLLDQIKQANIPTIHALVSNFNAMKMINSFTAKIRGDDTEKIHDAVKIVEESIDFDRLANV